jgi:hypothetical protein
MEGFWLGLRVGFLRPKVKKALSLKLGGVDEFKSSTILMGFWFYLSTLETVTLLTLCLFEAFFVFLLVMSRCFLVSIGFTV